MWNNLKTGCALLNDSLRYLYGGWKVKLTKSYFQTYINLLKKDLSHFHFNLTKANKQAQSIHDPNFKKLKSVAQGLHSLLPTNSLFSFSILLEANYQNSQSFKTCLQSILDQTSPSFEILLGIHEGQAHKIQKDIRDFIQQSPDKIKVIPFKNNESSIEIINHLASLAKGNFLLLCRCEDWLRPDLLFRYEQTLRILPSPEKTVLYCDEGTINSRNYFIPHRYNLKPAYIPFPYLFEPLSEKGLLVPRFFWNQIEGLRPSLEKAQFEDLLFRLEASGTYFQHIPIPLYYERELTQNSSVRCKTKLKEALKDYSQSKKLNWEIATGLRETDIRVIPEIKNLHSVQIIIPFKEQKELTLKCIQSLLKQTNISIKITAVDNGSQDKSIADSIRQSGGEVITINEPFNYSRLNNLAVKLTKTASDCDLILFLNNDIELEPDAIQEMVRWIDQPNIGMVGCRLHYPNGALQHGGTALTKDFKWENIEKMFTFDKMDKTKKIQIVDSVTAACALIKKKVFLEVGCFDETWYPIGYSDTNLALKVKEKKLLCLYTPYASGLHHESISRKEGIEDYEESKWLHKLIQKHKPSS